MTMPIDAARAKAREVGRLLGQEPFAGEELSVNGGIEQRRITPEHLRGPVPHGNSGFSPANGQALPSRDPRLAHYKNAFGEGLAGRKDTSHLAPENITSNGSYQHKNRTFSRATTTENNNTLTRSTAVNAQDNTGNISQILHQPICVDAASVSVQTVPAKRNKRASSSNAVPLGPPKMPGNAFATSFGETSKQDNANNAPLALSSSTASANANSVAQSSKSATSNAIPAAGPSRSVSANYIPVAGSSKPASTNASFSDAPNIPDDDIETLPSSANLSKKRAISSGPPTTDKAYQHALATVRTGKINWSETYITHVDFFFETDEFPPPKSKKRKTSSNTASDVASQPKQQQKEDGEIKEDEHLPHTIIVTSKNPATVALPTQKQQLTSSKRPLSTIAGTSQNLDEEDEVDLGSASMQNAIYNTGGMINSIVNGPYIYMPLSRFEHEYKAIQATKAPSLTLRQLRANYGHPAMAGYFEMVHYPANAIAKFIRLPFRRRPSQDLPKTTSMHWLEVFDMDASYCVFPGTTINISCLMYLLNTLPGQPPLNSDYRNCTVDKLYEYLVKRSAHRWSISKFDQGNNLLVDFGGRRE